MSVLTFLSSTVPGACLTNERYIRVPACLGSLVHQTAGQPVVHKSRYILSTLKVPGTRGQFHSATVRVHTVHKYIYSYSTHGT